MAQTVGFIGLGRMGLAMAENLQKGAFALRVYNRSAARADPLVKNGAHAATSPADAVTAGGTVCSMLADDHALEAIVSDDFLRALGPGGLHLSMSTVSPATTERMAKRHEQAGSTLVAAPVFGRPESAAAKQLIICASGPAAAKARAKPVFDAMGKAVFDFGDAPGAANVVKIAGNFLLTAAIEAMAEAGALAEKNGIPRQALLDMLTGTLFNGPIYTNYAKRIKDADFENVGFSVPLILKDMRLVQETSIASRTPMPTLNLLIDRYLRLLAQGHENLDASAIALGAAEDAGLSWGKQLD